VTCNEVFHSYDDSTQIILCTDSVGRDTKRTKTKVSEEKKKSFLPCEAQIPFCPKCKNLIMVRVNGTGHCSNCSFQCQSDVLVRKEIVATSQRSMPQRWLESAEEKKKRLKKKDEADQATVSEQCPKCNHDRASFYTMQLRSADEGQTVFYTCLKCSHKWRVNN